MKGDAVKCWACGSTLMLDKGNFYQCAKCGATWNDLPNTTFSPFSIESGGSDGGTKGKPRHVRAYQ